MSDTTEKLLDEILKDYQTPEQILGENGILKQPTKRLAERALQAEMTHHLGYEKRDYQGKATKDHLDDFLTDLPDNSQTTETTSKPICKQDNNSTPQTKPAVKSKKGNARIWHNQQNRPYRFW